MDGLREQIRVTDELARRPRRGVDPAIENAILRLLATRMNADPHVLLQELVDQVCALCDAGSCGVSLLETLADGTQIFRWVAISGVFRDHAGGFCRRDFSPCGDTLRLNAPQIFSRPARVFDYLSGVDPEVVEALIMPIPGVDGQAAPGTLWVVTHDEMRRFDEEDVRLLTSIAGFMAPALHMHDLLIAERQAREAAEAASAARAAFIADVSHEIRMPMTAIVGLCNILGRSESLSVMQEGCVQTLKASSQQLVGLVDNVLDMARIEAGAIELDLASFCLTELVDDVVAMVSVMANEKGLDIFVAPNDLGGAHFIGDALRIRQILTNLCSNAVKFTADGSVRIGLWRLASATQGKVDIAVTVEDTGIGIPPDKVASIFEKFNQGKAGTGRRYGGTGLGLPISAGLVKRMGGTISVASLPDRGSVFTVVLPLVPHAVAAGQPVEMD